MAYHHRSHHYHPYDHRQPLNTLYSIEHSPEDRRRSSHRHQTTDFYPNLPPEAYLVDAVPSLASSFTAALCSNPSSAFSSRPTYIHIPTTSSTSRSDDRPPSVSLEAAAVYDFCGAADPEDAVGALRRAKFDRTLFDDDRVLANLLKNEPKYMPSAHYFKTLQSDLKPFMRRMVTEWMLEVCEEQKCEDDVFLLAVNYLDRFLSQVRVQKCHLQLVAAVAMFVASKLKESVPLTADKLVLYTDNSITYEQMLTWELLLLGRLRWDVAAVTPLDFLDQILWRLEGVSRRLAPQIRRAAQQHAAATATDFKFIHYPPSMIAACCISAAIAGLNANFTHNAASAVLAPPPGLTAPDWTQQLMQLRQLQQLQRHFGREFCFDVVDVEFVLEQLQRITDIDAECLRQCHEQILHLGNAGAAESAPGGAPGSAPGIADDKTSADARRSEGALTTPTDVEAVALLIAGQ